jgi:hypothetical protein
MREHVQVEFYDGSRQWIKYEELYKLKQLHIKRIAATCSSNIKIINSDRTYERNENYKMYR